MFRISAFYAFYILFLLPCIGFSQTIMRPAKKNLLPSGIMLEAVDPLQKIFPESNLFPLLEAKADVARGEHATFQFAFRSALPVEHLSTSVFQLTKEYSLINQQNTNIGYVDYVRTGKPMGNPPHDVLISISGFFPDPIIDTSEINVRADYTQPIWVSVNIPKNTPPGEYNGQLNVKGSIKNKKMDIKVPFSIKVYPVTIDSTSLWVTNWFYYGGQLRFMNNGNSVEPYSDKYWTLLKVFARKMADYNQNVVKISPLTHTNYSFNNGKYGFDFSRFDKYVGIFIEAGALKRIEGAHIANNNFGVSVPILDAESTRFIFIPVSNDSAQNFYKQYVPALLAHLREKGWYKIYMQHIADEPSEKNFESYNAISTFFKNLAPEIPIIDAQLTSKVETSLNITVPLISALATEFDYYKGLQSKGIELWTYTCVGPQGNYANRFIELPLIKPRILHWINFRYNITGYLHWGYNYWHNDPFDNTVNPATRWPAGDCYIVYPGYEKLYSSMRLEAMRDGIVDYELLKMLAQKDPEKAQKISSEIVYNFDIYNTDIKFFRQKRKMILELLSK